MNKTQLHNLLKISSRSQPAKTSSCTSGGKKKRERGCERWGRVSR